MLTENQARPSLGHLQFIGDMDHTSAATDGAQKFPLVASARIILSSLEIGNGPPGPGTLRSHFLQTLLLVALQTTVFGPPPVVRNFRNAYRPDRLDFPCAFSTST